MAIKEINREWCFIANEYRRSFVLDSTEDVSDLPVCCAGSTAMVAGNGSAVYMVNASGAWVEL